VAVSQGQLTHVAVVVKPPLRGSAFRIRTDPPLYHRFPCGRWRYVRGGRVMPSAIWRSLPAASRCPSVGRTGVGSNSVPGHAENRDMSDSATCPSRPFAMAGSLTITAQDWRYPTEESTTDSVEQNKDGITYYARLMINVSGDKSYDSVDARTSYDTRQQVSRVNRCCLEQPIFPRRARQRS
jgi:hypothetical protein